ncbi:hypothetical protein TWF718_007814 [Orbilia javanica]|uniref:SCP domain-containing protein n=1 Tax=Orbilia javanica TaxID=47235 RepID=A0AAN8NT52_9PEZI
MLFRSVTLIILTTVGCITGALGASTGGDRSVQAGSGGFDNSIKGAGDKFETAAEAPPKVSFDSLGNLQLVIALINKYREVHQSPELTWNTSLAHYAANAAYPCRFGSSHGPYGEVIAGSSKVNNPEWFVWFMYDENKAYDFKNPQINDNATKHFTQLVWAGSKQVGCAFASGCSGLKYQLWCEFQPKGNTGSQLSYRNNVKAADKTKKAPGMPPAII